MNQIPPHLIDLVKHNLSKAFYLCLSSFIALLITGATFIRNNYDFANELALYAYYLLITAIALQIVSSLLNRKRNFSIDETRKFA